MYFNKDPNLNLAIDVMKTYLNAGEMRTKTALTLHNKYNLSEKDASKYAEEAFEWWSAAYE